MGGNLNNFYKQCQIQYESKAFSTVWIPELFAQKGKRIVVGKDKIQGIKAKVIKVYDSVKLTREQIDLNKKSKFDSIEYEKNTNR